MMLVDHVPYIAGQSTERFEPIESISHSRFAASTIQWPHLQSEPGIRQVAHPLEDWPAFMHFTRKTSQRSSTAIP